MHRLLRLHLKPLDLKRTFLNVLFVVLVWVILAGTVVMGWVRIKTGAWQAAQNTQTTVYSLETIPAIERVYASVGMTKLSDHGARTPISAAILPHHTEIGPDMDRFWAELAQATDPEVIILLSPAHGDQGNGLVQSTIGSWPTPFGTVQTDASLVLTLVKRAGVSLEPMSFQNEHGIGVHMPYTAKYFPDTTVVPIIAQSFAGETTARSVINVLRQQEKNILLISSIDFSHYLPEDQSLANDEQTHQAMVSSDFGRIDTFGPEHVDSSFALNAYLVWQQQTDCLSSERWHSYNPAGTSYAVYMCTQSPMWRLSAVGDVMLSRGVGARLSPQAISGAVSLLTHVSTESDVVFGNLESVIAHSGTPIEKPYSFRAAPEQITYLNTLGFTHLSVSNNHGEDYGKIAWEESVQNLKDHSITPIGEYHNEPIVQVSKIKGRYIAFFAFQNLTYPLDEQEMLEAIARAASEYDRVIVSMHWGMEYQLDPESQTVSLAHKIVDAGADVILGHHPHVQQSVETYKDALIFYSLGNFIFDQQGIQENTSRIATIDFPADGPPTYYLTPAIIQNYFPHHLPRIK